MSHELLGLDYLGTKRFLKILLEEITRILRVLYYKERSINMYIKRILLALVFMMSSNISCSKDLGFLYETEKSVFYSEAWLPKEPEFITLESKVLNYIGSLKPDRYSFIEPRSDYRYQYISGVGNDFRENVWIVGFCRDDWAKKDNWKYPFRGLPIDGGNCYFLLQYDPKEDRLYGFEFNADV